MAVNSIGYEVAQVIHALESLSPGSAIGGIQDTLQALNERRVQRLLVCANVVSSVGWQCHTCLALSVDTEAQPDLCLYCDCIHFHKVDLKGEMIARAYRSGCSIQIISRCPELERVGGVGALLHEGMPVETDSAQLARTSHQRQRTGCTGRASKSKKQRRGVHLNI